MRIASATLVLVLSTVASALVNNFWRVGKDVRLHVHHRAAPRVVPDAHGDSLYLSETSPQRHLTYKLPASRARVKTSSETQEQIKDIIIAPETTRRPEPRASRFLLQFVPPDPFQCRECTGGSYCYQDALTRCPPHSTSQNRSDDASDCRCKAGFYQNASWADGGACLPCTAGFYCPDGRVACHAGSDSAEGSSVRESCICTAGFTQAGENCTACAPGTYKADAGSAGCSQCAGGAYADGSAAAECAACPAHTVSPPGAADAAACVAAAGAYGPPGRAAQLCAEGFYADKTNSSECEPCSSYSYLPSTGATSVQACLACPAGSAVYGSANQSSAPNGVGRAAADCVCQPGFEAAGAACAACAAGAYKAEAGGGPCAPCPADTFAVPGGVRCLACTADSRSDPGSPSVQSCSCNAGYSLDSSEMALDASCRACEPGKFKAAFGNAACSSCAAGFYQPAPAQSACLLCAEDRFVPALQAASCVACGANERAPAGSSGGGACGCRSGFARSAPALLLGQWQVGLPLTYDFDNPLFPACDSCPFDANLRLTLWKDYAASIGATTNINAMGARSGHPDGFGYTGVYTNNNNLVNGISVPDVNFRLPLSPQHTVVKVIYRAEQNNFMYLYIDNVLKQTCADTRGKPACEYQTTYSAGQVLELRGDHWVFLGENLQFFFTNPADIANPDLDGDGDADCLACPPGSFHNASGPQSKDSRAECERCPRGHVTLQSASGGAHDCVACDVGSYAADTVN